MAPNPLPESWEYSSQASEEVVLRREDMMDENARMAKVRVPTMEKNVWPRKRSEAIKNVKP